jgi:hypothetical protein
MIAPTIARVPTAVGQVKFSPSQKIPKAAANSGAVEVRVEQSVGPIYRMPASARLAETAGRKHPTRTKISTAGCNRWSISRKTGAARTNSIAEVQIVIVAPLRESIWARPRL